MCLNPFRRPARRAGPRLQARRRRLRTDRCGGCRPRLRSRPGPGSAGPPARGFRSSNAGRAGVELRADQELELEGVARRAVDVGPELHHPPRVVVRHTFHRQQRRPGSSSRSRASPPSRRARPPSGGRCARRDAGGARISQVETGGLRLVGAQGTPGGRWLRRSAIGSPCALRSRSTRWTSLPSATPSAAATSAVPVPSCCAGQRWRGAGPPPQVVVERAELQRAATGCVRPGCRPSGAPSACRRASGWHSADGRAGQAQPGGESISFPSRAPGPAGPAHGRFQLLRQLEVERHRAGAVHAQRQRPVGSMCGHGASVVRCPDIAMARRLSGQTLDMMTGRSHLGAHAHRTDRNGTDRLHSMRRC